MAKNKPSVNAKGDATKGKASGAASGGTSDQGEGKGTPATEDPVPQQRDLARYVLSFDKTGGTIVKMEKIDEETGETKELGREDYAAAFASARAASPGATIAGGYASPVLALPMVAPQTTEGKQAMNMNELSYNQGAADAVAALAGYGVPDQFGGVADAYGGYSDAAGGYSDAFGGYADASGGYYDAAGGYSDPYGGYSDAAGGYTDALGGYTDASGGYFDVYGGYTDPAGGYTDVTGNYMDPASVAYTHGVLSQMPY